MWSQEYSLIFDIAVTGLLLVAIYYAAVLNHKLVALGDARGDLQRLVRDLAETTNQAKSDLGGLEQTTAATIDMLQKHADDSHRLADNIAFFVKRGEDVAERLEAALSQAGGLAVLAEEISRPAPEPRLNAASGAPATPRARQKTASKISEFLARTERKAAAPTATKRSMSTDESELVRAFQAIR